MCVKSALNAAGLDSSDLAAVGITNQRESTLVWDRKTGTPLHRLIVWNDVRTEPICRYAGSIIIVAAGCVDVVVPPPVVDFDTDCCSRRRCS